LGALLSKKISVEGAIGYWVAQVVGAIAGAFVLYGLVHWGRVADETAALGTNAYGARINAGGAMVLEFILTFLFVFVVLLVTARVEQTSIRGVAIGLALAVCNLVAIPLDGASINPARSLGPALFNGGAPLRQIWLFIIFPLLGGAAAALAGLLFLRGPVETVAEGGRPGVDWRAADTRRPEGRSSTDFLPGRATQPPPHDS
jgi:aquaporin Z